MLTFEEKQAILDTFAELERKPVSLGRVNYHYEDSAYDKKTVVYHLHPNGNGFVYAGKLDGSSDYEVDGKGFVNIRELGADELRELVHASIRSLTARTEESRVEADSSTGSAEERWVNEDGATLTVTFEEDLWYVYAGDNLDTACETYEEVEEYMAEEGFRKA